MVKNNQAKARDVRTTILVVNSQAIDWGRLRQNCHVIRYAVRPQGERESDEQYYGHIHNWYKQESDFPCYFYTHGPHLYVKYESPHEVIALSNQGRELRHEVVDLQDATMLPKIMNVLLADFFHVDGRFVSNADFFLWATTDEEFITGLKIRLTHNWRKDAFFIFSDRAIRLRRLRPIEFDKTKSWRRVFYGRFYPAPGMSVFKQFKKDQLTPRQLEEGIYELFEGSRANRANLTFHSTKSLSDLEQTRSFLLTQFVEKFTAYLHGLGLPFTPYQLPMQAVHKTPIQMTKRQLPDEKSRFTL